MANEKAKSDYKHWVGAVPKIENWYKNFNFVLVESMEDLESIFKDKKDYYMAFDTETTGLDFEEIDLVGYSFCLDGKTAYYVPVYHFQYEGNLGEESVKFIYERMCEAKKVFMYNMRYDARIMEYYGYKENKADLDKRRWMYAKFDMSSVDYYDVSVPVWLADTNQKYPSLKWSSLHFLGIEQLHFDEVIENAGSFFYLNPSENEDTVFYAAADALCTFLLATATVKYFTEAKHSAKFDNLMLYPLLHYENERIWLDGDVLKNLYIIATDRVDRMERDVYAMIGGQINLNSPVQVAQAFERLGIDTGERTSKGTMSVGIKILADLPKEYVEKFPALKSYINYKKTAKLISSYIKPLLKEYERRGYCRFAYKTTEVPTGRLACGKDGKNSFFSPINAQSLPKPHVKMEDVFDLGDRNLFSKKDNIIMGYKFVYSSYDEEGKHIIPDDPTYIGWVEGMDDDLNIRMAISPKMLVDSGDDEFLYCLDPKTSFIETKEFKYAPLFYIIEKLESGNIVHVKTPKGYRKITNYIHSGKKDAYKLVLKNGREIICSKEHSFMTDRGWLKLKDFTEDDSVIVDENMFSDVSWLSLYGYEDRYKINVHTGEMLGPDGHGSKFVRKCNTTVCSSGYAQYNVSKPGQKLKSRTRSYSVHRAILESYYESSKPFGFRVVDHIDSNKENNTIKNLQIGDNRYNLNKYSTKIKFKNGNSNPNAKHWEQYHDRVQKIIDIATRLGGFTKNLSRLISKKYGVSESYSYWVKRKMDRKENILLFKDSSNIECIIGLGYQIDMVDIEVEDEHCFYCNSILTHNCSFDYAAEELRIAANLSREPNWVDAFVHGDDIHKRCYSLDTEFLTRDGWKTYEHIGIDTEIAQYNEDTKELEFVRAGHAYFNETDTMYHFVGNNTDLLVTPNHRMYDKGRDNWYVKRADELYKKRYYHTICSPISNKVLRDSDIVIDRGNIDIKSTYHKDGFSISVDDFVELLGYVITDGGTCLRSCGTKTVYFSQSEVKADVLARMQDLNRRLGGLFKEEIDYCKGKETTICGRVSILNGNFHRFSLTSSALFDVVVEYIGGNLKKDRVLSNKMLQFSDRLLIKFLDAMYDGDGLHDNREGRENSRTLLVQSKKLVEQLQLILINIGYSTNIRDVSDRYSTNLYKLNYVKDKRVVRGSNRKTEIIKYDKPVKSVCFAVPSTLLFVRRNGKTSVCGNTAVAIWGEEHYNRDYRKMAKYANFSILYGASSHSLYADSRYGFKSLQEAEDFYNKYKKALPTLFQWQDRLIYSARRKGMLQTFFGRPRRLRSYYENKQIGFANRSAGNTSVQGVAGDILKMVMIKLWRALFNNEEFKNDVAWRVAIHDEIGYTIRATKLMRILKIIKETQSVKLPEWPVEIITDPSVGWSMGRVYDFHMVEDDSELGYHFEPDLA